MSAMENFPVDDMGPEQPEHFLRTKAVWINV